MPVSGSGSFGGRGVGIDLLRGGRRARRGEIHIDRLVDLVHDRLERHDAGLPHGCAHGPADMHAVAPAQGEIELRHKPLHRIDAGRLRERRAHLRARLERDVFPGRRNLVQRHQHAPGSLGLFHVALLCHSPEEFGLRKRNRAAGQRGKRLPLKQLAPHP